MDCKKILIIDDSPVVLKVLDMTLAAYGYHTFTARNGEDGLNIVRQEKPHLILLDINFRPEGAPGQAGTVVSDGFVILDRLRRMDQARGVPIIIITGGDPAEYQKKCSGRGVVGVLPKPIMPDALLAITRQTLGETFAEA